MKMIESFIRWVRGKFGRPQAASSKPPMILTEPPRAYTKREVVLPSGRFASLSAIRMDDIMVTEDSTALMRMVKLASRVVAIDGEPLTLSGALFMEGSEFVPILHMLHAELRCTEPLSRGVA